MSFEHYNLDNAGTTDPDFRMETVDAEAAAERLLVEYGIAPSGDPAGGMMAGATGEEQQQLPPGVAAAPPVMPPAAQPLTFTQPEEQTVTERDELIRALQRGVDPATAYAQFQHLRGTPSVARAARAPEPPAFQVHQQVVGVSGLPVHQQVTGGGGLLAPPTNVQQTVQHGGGIAVPPLPVTLQVPPPATTTTAAATVFPGVHGPAPAQDRAVGREQQVPTQHAPGATGGEPAAHRPGSLAAAAAAFFPRCEGTEYINAEIEFQFGARGSPQKQTEMREGVLASSSLAYSAFWYIPSNEKSTTLEVLHSPTKYFHHEIAVTLRGAMLAFVGDRSPRMRPTCVRLQQQKAFGWSDVALPDDRTVISAFYSEAANASRFFRMPTDAGTTTVSLPNMCVLPMSLVPWAIEKKRTLQEARHYIETLDQAQPADGLQVNWLPVLDWLAGASIDDSTGNGRLSVNHALVPITEEGFHVWQDDRMNAMLGNLAAAASAATASGSSADVQREMARLLATASGTLQVVQQSTAANAAAASPSRAATSSSSSKGKELDEWALTSLTAFCHVRHPRFLPPIWLVFQSTKNVKSHISALMVAMRGFAIANNLEIEPNLFFPNEWMNRIVTTEFSSGSVHADYSTLGHGLDIMPFLGWTAVEIRRFKKRQDAEEKTRATRTMEEEQQRVERDHLVPPSTYDEVLLAWTTTYVALQVLLGAHCPLTENFRLGREVLKSPAVVARRKEFNRKTKLCRELIFHANDDMAQYFSQRKTPGFFRSANPAFPTSLLRQLFTHMHWMTEVNRPSFPNEWIPAQDRAASTMTADAVQRELKAAVAAQTRELTQQLKAFQSSGGTGVGRGGSSPGGDQTNLGKRGGIKREPFSLTEVPEGLRGLLAKYHDKFDGRVLWKDFRTYGNFTDSQFPTLEKYKDAQGRSTICNTHVLGRCPQRDSCPKVHVPHSDLTDNFIQSVITSLRSAVDYVTANIEPMSATKRRALSNSRGRGSGGASR